jgi:hypothetical protein
LAILFRKVALAAMRRRSNIFSTDTQPMTTAFPAPAKFPGQEGKPQIAGATRVPGLVDADQGISLEGTRRGRLYVRPIIVQRANRYEYPIETV